MEKFKPTLFQSLGNIEHVYSASGRAKNKEPVEDSPIFSTNVELLKRSMDVMKNRSSVSFDLIFRLSTYNYMILLYLLPLPYQWLERRLFITLIFISMELNTDRITLNSFEV